MAKLPWTRLDIQHFVTLMHVARCGSFTEAAAQLGYTQSAVSQQISRLESLVGHLVVNRSAGGKTVTLTPAGRVLLQHAETLTGTLQRIAIDVDALSRGAAGILRVGCYESVGAKLLPSVLTSFHQEYPKVQVALTELPDDGDLLHRVESNDLDLTFVVFPLTAGPFESQPLLEDPYVLVVASDSPLAESTLPIDLDDHPDLPLMSYAELRPPHSMEARLGRPAYRSRVVFRSNQNTTLLGLAGQGYAAAVIPQLGLDPRRQDVHARKLASVNPRIIGIAWHQNRELSEAASAFIRTARAVASQLSFPV
ncbi:LysR family transcriptional regulator [Streptomyces sp. NPDC001292]|uniref:LysR family transcriptional regulator n=1 Tax=Streptomyces sp. NPDC001292 TaxID=3364558 RepID=UPI0036CFEF52